MFLWICLIVGLLLGAVFCIPEGYVAPSDEIKVETIRGSLSLDELLEEWDLQDHLDELEEEE